MSPHTHTLRCKRAPIPNEPKHHLFAYSLIFGWFCLLCVLETMYILLNHNVCTAGNRYYGSNQTLNVHYITVYLNAYIFLYHEMDKFFVFSFYYTSESRHSFHSLQHWTWFHREHATHNTTFVIHKSTYLVHALELFILSQPSRGEKRRKKKNKRNNNSDPTCFVANLVYSFFAFLLS